ncbi:hypothetical protein WAE58_21780 [Pedobacter panaciterrae]|uniref:DUF3168 domain-containing protein n=1 Tax=Pedobacter panaciterrae TaxID=363849 RepID=A0ABU8NSJ7_9SPHI
MERQRMKDGIDMVLDVREMINVPSFKSLIDGEVYGNIRPDGSIKADVVVTAIGINDDQDQDGAGNIRIYVPKIKQNGVMVTDQTRLWELGKAIVDLMDDKFKNTFRVWIDSRPKLNKDSDGSYHLHMGYQYHSIRENSSI